MENANYNNKNNIKLTEALNLLSKTQEGDFPKRAKILGLDIVVNRNVFNPMFFIDAEVFTSMIEKYMKEGVRFLELGSGTGITAIYASKKGCDVVATDINPSATENILENAKNNDASIDVRLGDLFEPVKSEQFDIIYWNIPFMKYESEISTDLEKSVLDKDDILKYKLLDEFSKHLMLDGSLLIGYSPNFCNFDFEKKFSEAGFIVNKVGSEKRAFESVPDGIIFEIIEIKNEK